VTTNRDQELSNTFKDETLLELLTFEPMVWLEVLVYREQLQIKRGKSMNYCFLLCDKKRKGE
jgi:hypothetical protein